MILLHTDNLRACGQTSCRIVGGVMWRNRALSFRHCASRFCAAANRGKHAALSPPSDLIENFNEKEDKANAVCDLRCRANLIEEVGSTTLSRHTAHPAPRPQVEWLRERVDNLSRELVLARKESSRLAKQLKVRRVSPWRCFRSGAFSVASPALLLSSRVNIQSQQQPVPPARPVGLAASWADPLGGESVRLSRNWRKLDPVHESTLRVCTCPSRWQWIPRTAILYTSFTQPVFAFACSCYGTEAPCLLWSLTGRFKLSAAWTLFAPRMGLRETRISPGNSCNSQRLP